MKVTYQENYRVVVEPRGLGNFGCVHMSDGLIERDPQKRAARYKDLCESIKDDIKRHVDDVGSVYIESDTVKECSHCGSTWSEKSDQYNGGCCDADQVPCDAVEALIGFYSAMATEAA
jgi:hypothetical protein